MGDERHTRTTSDGPFCWQSKAARRFVREALDGDGPATVMSALAVYDALTEIASDTQAEIFRTTHAHVAKLSGASVPTVKRRLKDLREIGLVVVETPKLKAPSTYHLPKYTPIAHGDLAIAHGAVEGPRATSEECSEECSEESPRKRTEERRPGAGGASVQAPLWDEVLSYGETLPIPLATLKAFFLTNQSNGWTTPKGKRRMKIRDWRKALEAFANTDKRRRKPKAITNDEFWAWVDTLPPDAYGEPAREAAEVWVEFMARKSWKVEDRITHELEPLRDHKSAFLAWRETIWNDTELQRGNWA